MGGARERAARPRRGNRPATPAGRAESRAGGDAGCTAPAAAGAGTRRGGFEAAREAASAPGQRRRAGPHPLRIVRAGLLRRLRPRRGGRAGCAPAGHARTARDRPRLAARRLAAAPAGGHPDEGPSRRRRPGSALAGRRAGRGAARAPAAVPLPDGSGDRGPRVARGAGRLGRGLLPRVRLVAGAGRGGRRRPQPALLVLRRRVAAGRPPAASTATRTGRRSSRQRSRRRNRRRGASRCAARAAATSRA